MRQHPVAQVDVFRDRLGRKSADLNQRSRRTTNEVPTQNAHPQGVLGGLKDVEEESLVVDRRGYVQGRGSAGTATTFA
jgi:hypothetical protein